MKSLLIKNGTIITASDTFVADIFVEDGRIRPDRVTLKRELLLLEVMQI